MHRAGILQSLHGNSSTPKNALGFALEREIIRGQGVYGNVTEEKKSFNGLSW